MMVVGHNLLSVFQQSFVQLRQPLSGCPCEDVNEVCASLHPKTVAMANQVELVAESNVS
jgi:hypothetical protein